MKRPHNLDLIFNMTEQQILKAADDYVGHPEEIDEDLSIYIKRKAFADGAKYVLNNLK